MPTWSGPLMSPKKESTAATRVATMARLNCRSMTKTAMAPSISPASTAPPPKTVMPVYTTPLLARLPRPTVAASVPAAPSELDEPLGPDGHVGKDGQDGRRRMPRGRGLERLCADDQSDEEEDGHEGLDGDDGQQQGGQSE